jgi:hypothetical protein
MSTVIRVEKSRDFVVMNNRFLRNKEMSLKAKGLLALCLSLPEDWDYSINGLVAITKESVTAVRNAMKELEELGYMKINKLQNKKGHFYYEYVIYETPHSDFLYVDNATTEKLPVENLPVENLVLENVGQQSTNNKVSNNKELNNNLYILEERLTPEISKLFKEYLEMREEEKMPVTKRGLQTLLNRLEELSNGNTQIQKMMLENAIMNKWKNLFRPTDQEIAAHSKALVETLRSFYGI